MASRPHVAVWGKTGSGKSTVLLGLILQFFGMGADVRFIDGKSEFSSFGTFYGKHKIGSNVAGVVGILERVKAEVEHRQQFIAELNSQDGKMGRTAADLNYRPLVLLVDEIGAILATMAPKSQKEMIESLVAIIMKGRSVGVHVVLATQDPRLIHFQAKSVHSSVLGYCLARLTRRHSEWRSGKWQLLDRLKSSEGSILVTV